MDPKFEALRAQGFIVLTFLPHVWIRGTEDGGEVIPTGRYNVVLIFRRLQTLDTELE